MRGASPFYLVPEGEPMKDYIHVVREIDNKRKVKAFLSDAVGAIVFFVSLYFLFILTPPYQ